MRYSLFVHMKKNWCLKLCNENLSHEQENKKRTQDQNKRGVISVKKKIQNKVCGETVSPCGEILKTKKKKKVVINDGREN